MYLISQLWWFLLLAFLLGALLGYLLWRACGRRRIETHYERSNKELVSRLGALEVERSRFSGAAVDAEGGNVKLKSEIAILQGKLADTSSRLNAAVDTADAKLKSYVDGVRQREEELGNEVEKLKREALAARKDLDDAKTRHAAELKKSRDEAAAEAAKKHAADVKKAGD